ncbi:InlB B-repeat-containing protein [bacterium]|nr:InlB B-repeat-containing protein [bacterium]MBQ7616907.1 InlB B-repeat-containing protein [bacterium]
MSQTFSFDGWNVTAVTADADYTASFTAHPRQYSVTFVDEDGTTILKAATNYDYGTLPENIVQPDNLTKQNYVFAEWTPALAEVTADATYTASWYEDMNNDGQPDNTEDKYSVTYTDGVD